MTLRKRRTAVITLLILLLCLTSLGATRVVSSQTLVVQGYIPPRTTVSITEDGQVLLTTNSREAYTEVMHVAHATILSVVAR